MRVLAAAAGLLAAFASIVQAQTWTVTKYVEVIETTSKYSTYTYVYTGSTTATVKATVTPTASPVSSYSTTYRYQSVVVVYLYLNAGAVASSDLVPATATYDPDVAQTVAYTYFVSPVVWTAPASCPTAFTVSTYTTLDLPSVVYDLLTPVSTTASVSTGAGGDVYSRVTAYLSQGAVPISADSTTAYSYSYYIRSCRNPTATGSAYWGPSTTSTRGSGSSSGGSSSGGSSSDDWYVCYYYGGCTTFRVWVIIIAVILPTLFLFGFFENFLWFRRLMLGKSALRFGTVSWILLSLWVLCFTRKSPARSADDQVRLREQWKAMSAGTKWKLWWKWGFRHAYPVELLGPDPRTNPGFGAYPPTSVAYNGYGPPPPPPSGMGGPGGEKAGTAVAAAPVPNGQQSWYAGPNQQSTPGYVVHGNANGGPPTQAPPEGYQWVPVTMPPPVASPHQSWMQGTPPPQQQQHQAPSYTSGSPSVRASTIDPSGQGQYQNPVPQTATPISSLPSDHAGTPPPQMLPQQQVAPLHEIHEAPDSQRAAESPADGRSAPTNAPAPPSGPPAGNH